MNITQILVAVSQGDIKDTDTNSCQPLLQPQSQHQQASSQHQNVGSGDAGKNQHEYSSAQLNTLASYGQLVTPQADSQRPSSSEEPSQMPGAQSQSDPNEAGPSSSAAHSMQQGPRPQITVTDPQKHAEKTLLPVSGGYVTYAVKSFMHLPKYSSRGTLVRRRFRDFVVSS